MRPSRRAALTAAAAALLVLPVTAPPAQGTARADDPPRAVGSDDVAAADRQVSAAAAVLRDSRARLRTARGELRAADAVVVTARSAAQGAQRAAALAAAQSQQAQDRLAQAQSAYAGAQDEVGALAAGVYMQGPYSELEAVLTAADPGDFAERLAAVRSLGQSYDRVLGELAAAKAELGLSVAQAQAATARALTQQQTAAARLAQARTAQQAAVAAKGRVDAIVAARAAALALARDRQQVVRRQYARYRAYQRQVAEQARRASQRSAGSSGSGSPSASGSLQWPVPGAGTSGGVGWRVHPVYGYRSCHTGVDIRGGTGTPIHAAASGTVFSVVDGGAYGLHTMIDHGNGLVTMYAHQSRTAVPAGQQVSRGQVIGYVGSSGWVTGPHLHFEVHVNGVPYDPMGWFGGGSKHPVPCYRG